MVNLDRCVGSCNTLNDLSEIVCVSNKTEDLNLCVFFIMITLINKSKTLIKHISCECICKLVRIKCNLNQKWNGDICWCECKCPKECHVCETSHIVSAVVMEL